MQAIPFGTAFRAMLFWCDVLFVRSHVLKRKSLQLAIGIAVSAFFVWWALKGLDLRAVAVTLRTANYWWLVPGILVYFVGLWVRSWRWHYMLRSLKAISTGRLFPLVCIGYFGNNVYPFRAGEVIRSLMLKRREDVAVSSSLATVFLERTFDGLTMLMFVFLALPFAPMPPAFRKLVILATLIFGVATAIFVWAAVRPERLVSIYGWVSARLLPARVQPALNETFDRFLLGLQCMSSPIDVTMIFGTSILIWLIETVKYWFVMHAFGFTVGFLVLMLINGVVNLATTLPSAPGYIGTFDGPGINILTAYGVDSSLAASYILTLHAALWLPVTVVGGYYFLREQLRWSDLGDAAATTGNPSVT
jgi:hypothetical protein